MDDDLSNVNYISGKGEETISISKVDDTTTEKKNEKVTILNPDYYDENNLPKYQQMVDYENEIREEINKTPLVSERLSSDILMKEYESSKFEVAIKDLCSNFKTMRTIRRDGKLLTKETAFTGPFFTAYLKRLLQKMITKLMKTY